MRNLLEAQHARDERLFTALERVAVSGSQLSPGTVSDFRCLHPVTFTGEESLLDAEHWLINTEDLSAARIPDTDWVDVVKI